MGLGLLGFAAGLAVQSLVLSKVQPTGLWFVAVALLPLHAGAAGGVLLELLRTGPPRSWPTCCALGRLTGPGVLRVLLTMPWVFALVSLVHWAAAALCRRGALAPPSAGLFPALAGVGGASAVAAAVALLVWVPLTEEVLFRRLLTDALAGTGARRPGVWSAAVFALAHGVPAHVPGLVLLGLALQHLRRRHGSLWAPILAHALYNAFSLAWWLVWAKPG